MKHRLALCGLLACACVSANEIEEVVVTASPLNLEASSVVSGINRISSEDLRRTGSANLADALSAEPGVAAATFGPGVGAPIIRGQSSPRVAFARGGQPVTDASDSGADHALADEIYHATAIEVIRGPAALRYGPGAIGGVVNLVEPSLQVEDGFEAQIDLGFNHNNQGAIGSAVIGFEDENIQYRGGLTHRESGDIRIPGLADKGVDDADETTNGHVGNTGAESTSVWSSLGWQGNGWRAQLRLDKLENTYGIPFGAHEHHHGHEEEHDEHDDEGHEDEGHEEESVRIEMNKLSIAPQVVFESPLPAVEQLTLRADFSRYQHSEIERAEGVDEVGTQFERDSISVRAEALHSLLPGRGYAGIEWFQADLLAIGDEAFVPASDQVKQALYMVQRMETEKGALELGARLDHQEVRGPAGFSVDHRPVNLGASYLYRLSDGLQLGISANRSQRAPNPTELLAEGEHIATASYEIGDQNLSSETSKSLEFSLAYSGLLSVQLNLHQTRFDGYIAAENTGLLFNHDLEEDGFSGLAACSLEAAFDDPEEAEEAVGCFAYSQRDARFYGLEAAVWGNLTEQLQLRLWTDFTDARYRAGDYVPRVAPKRIGARLSYSAGPLDFWLSGVKASAQDRLAVGELPTDGYFRLDSSVRWTAESLTLFVTGKNLTNQDIRLSTSFLKEVAPEPGRSLIVGASYHF